MRSYIQIGLALLLFTLTEAQGVQVKMLKVEGAVNPAPLPSITISWDTQRDGYTITIYRRVLGEEGSATWGSALSTITHPATAYVDTNVVVGTAYEYKIHRPSFDSTYNTATAYLTAGMQTPLTEGRGKIMLIVDNTVATPLATELERLERDLIGDGWSVIRHNSPRHSSGTAEDLKAWIVAKYNEDTANTKALLLFGRLPILMSGREAPDGHTSLPHATDLFYGDMDGIWTDTSMNHAGINVPGDGIYDQNAIPDHTIEIQVGRVDLAGMTYWSTSEVELLRNYLNKDHLWRSGLAADPRKAVYAASSHLYSERAQLHSLFQESDVIEVGNWSPEAENNPYTWGVSFGDATLGNYPGYNFKMAFTINFGSYKQRWELNNNGMRAILAMPEYGLTSAWGARPYWFFHHMGMGETIGYSARRTQNNYYDDYSPSGTYWFEGAIHVNLMGDPTLRMYTVPPPSKVTTATNAAEEIIVNWIPSAGSVLGYHVYRAADMSDTFVRLTGALESSTTFTDTTAPAGTNIYMVRAIRLEDAASGTFYNPSQGSFASYPAQRVALEVATSLGIAEPPTGTHDYSWHDASLICRIPNAVITSGTTQTVVTGWSGTGDVPATGTGSSTALLDLKQNSSITWQWATNYWLAVDSDANGVVNITDGWHTLGTSLALTATPTAFRHLFSHWTGSGVPAGHEQDNPLSVIVESALEITANFVAMPNPDNFLPYTESFEQYPPDTLLAGAGGWYAEIADAAQVTTDTNVINGITDYGNFYPYPINTTHAQAAVIDSPTSVNVRSPTNKVIIAKMLIRMTPFINESPPDISENNISLAFALSHNEYFMLYHADPVSEEINWTTFASTPLTGNTWHTITIQINFNTTGVGGYCFFQIKLDDGSWLTDPSGYSSNNPAATPGGSWFALTTTAFKSLSGFTFEGEVQLDDLLVSENWKGGAGDYDHDGMWDMWEYFYFGGTNQPGGSASDDYDLDGANNLAEYQADTSPANTNSILTLTSIITDAGGVTVSWKGGTESRQYLEWADALISPAGTIWHTILTNLPPVAPTLEFLDADNTAPMRFYRIRAIRE